VLEGREAGSDIVGRGVRCIDGEAKGWAKTKILKFRRSGAPQWYGCFSSLEPCHTLAIYNAKVEMEQDTGPLLAPPPNSDGTPSIRSPERTANLIRFQSELEVGPSPFCPATQMLIVNQFIQCLSNPLYLHELHTQSYLSQPEFLNYLEYLDYWRKPPYIRFITSVSAFTSYFVYLPLTPV
jgi:hypothetical protein